MQEGDKGSIYTQTLYELIQSYVIDNPNIDPNRIIIGGASNGGYMTIEMLLAYPDYFYKAYPICEAFNDNYISDEKLESIKNVPIWFINSLADDTVDPNKTSIPTHKRLVEMGNTDARISLFDNVIDTSGRFTNEDSDDPYEYDGHWSWIYFHNNEVKDENNLLLWDWLGQIDGHEVTADLTGKITDAGEVISKISLTFPEEVDVTNLNIEDFAINQKSIIQIGKNKGQEYYSGERNIVDINKLENEVILELDENDGFGSTLTWLSAPDESRNYPGKLDIDISIKSDEKFVFNVNYDIKNDETALFESVKPENGLNYQYYEAQDSDTLIVWYHGNGEGDIKQYNTQNNVAQMLANRGTVAWASDELQEIFKNAHIMAFQVPDTWYNAESNSYLQTTYEQILALIKDKNIDPNKVIVAGASAGGKMAVKMIIAHPDFFRYGIISCPAIENAGKNGGKVPTDDEIKSILNTKTGLWLIHGETDASVNPETSSKRIFDLLSEGKDVTETVVNQEINSGFTTYETPNNKYKLTIYNTVNQEPQTFDDGSTRNVGKILVQEDYNKDGEFESVEYNDHWTWIFTLNNNPTDKDGTAVMNFAANYINQADTSTSSVIKYVIPIAAIAIVALVIFTRKKKDKSSKN